MFEHRCGNLTCPECMTVQTFVAVVYQGQHYNLRGDKVTHITDASCRVCGYTYGRADVRDEVTGSIAKGRPIISDALALAAARAADLPPAAALFGNAENALRAEALAAAASLRYATATPAAGPGSLRSPGPATPAAGPCSLRSPAPATGAAPDSLRSPGSAPPPVSGSLRSPAPGPSAPAVPDFVDPPSAAGDPDDSVAAFLEQHRLASRG